MIISRTPYRISFFGGGTDYHNWYQEHGAAVLTSSINHYCYLQCRLLPPFFNHKSRIVWSKIEEVSNHQEIVHPAVRAVLEYLKINLGVEITHQGDLPARSGLGSSSAFTVGLLNAMYALRGMISSKRELACEAIHIERDILKENVGVQDQIETAYGGLNKIVIHQNGNFDVVPVVISPKRLHELQDHLLLFFTGISRTASEIAGAKMRSIPSKKTQLAQMHKMVETAESILTSKQDITAFGELLHESWLLKRQLTANISLDVIDDAYERARQAGAIGGKLLGAGGGGFMLLFVEPEAKIKVQEALQDLLFVPFDFEMGGSQIILYNHPMYDQRTIARRNYQHLTQYGDDNLKLFPLAHERLTHLLTVEESG